MSAIRIVIIGLFFVQLATGVILMTAYAPSTASAWGSVWYIQTQVGGGWLIRGVHHFASDAMLILLGAAIVRCLWIRAYTGGGWRLWCALLVALGVTLAASLTGHLLPWDQEGFWGTTVRSNILAKTPMIGETLRRLLLGGVELGQLTLTRFYTLHIILLPAVLLVLYRFQRSVAPSLASGVRSDEATKRRGDDGELKSEPGAEATGHSGLRQDGAVNPSRGRKPTDKTCDEKRGADTFNGAFFFAALMLSVVLIAYFVCSIGGSTLLDAPADRTATDYPARPEWHTLFLFQWLKYFQGPTAEVVGAIVIPSIILFLIILIPAYSRLFSPDRAHRLARNLVAGVAVAAVGLTGVNLWHDRNPADTAVAAAREKKAASAELSPSEQAILRARQFHEQREQARFSARRAVELAAAEGIPPDGPLTLLARDPMTRGAKLFAANCASCHRYDGHDGLGSIPPEPAAASDLKNFASYDWIRRFLDNPMDDRYFGRIRTPEGELAHTRMDRFVRERLESADEEARKFVAAEYDAVSAFLADQSAMRDPSRDREGAGPDVVPSSDTIARGREVFMTLCNECHTFGGERTGTTKAPEMKGYGSVQWLKLMIAEPDHETRYRAAGREKARMPRFAEKLSEKEIDLIARWIRQDR